MARTSPLGTVGSAGLALLSGIVHVVVYARGDVANTLTPGPSKCVASNVVPSGPHARAHNLCRPEGNAARATPARSLARSSSIASSFEQATKRFTPEPSIKIPAGSAHKGALFLRTLPVLASSA